MSWFQFVVPLRLTLPRCSCAFGCDRCSLIATRSLYPSVPGISLGRQWGVSSKTHWDMWFHHLRDEIALSFVHIHTHTHIYIHIGTGTSFSQPRFASPCIFRNIQSRFFLCHVSLACNSSSIHLLLGQPFGDRFCTTYQLLLVVLATFFYIDIFSNHYFLDLSYSTPSSRLWEALHSLFYISFSEFAGTSTNSTTSYLVSLCLVLVALFPSLQLQPLFYFIDLFSAHIFLDFSHFNPG